jgi:MFS family permease
MLHWLRLVEHTEKSYLSLELQLSTPRWVVGRALALYQTGGFGGMAGGSWAWGVIAENFGADRAMFVTAILLILGALAGLGLPLPDSADLDLNPRDTFTKPPLRLDPKPRSGPIMILVDYEIAQQDVTEFLAVMSARRYITIRVGPQQ